MLLSLFSGVETGIIFAIMAIGVYLTFRVLDFPDLTVDGSFVTGAAMAAVLVSHGQSTILATLAGMVVGFLAGCITGILHAKGNINALLAGILMSIALWSINLRIMGTSNIPLLGEETLLTKFTDFWDGLNLNAPFTTAFEAIGLDAPATWSVLFFVAVVALVVKFAIDWFLKTQIGLALRATGDNKRMIRSLSGNTDVLIIAGVGISNGLVGLAGALYAQYQGFADVGMGIGMIIIGLASVIIGEALFGKKSIARVTLAVAGGAVVYRLVVTLALRVEFLEAGDLKLITAIIVVAALIVPKIMHNRRDRRRKQRRHHQLTQNQGAQNQGVQRDAETTGAG